MASAESIEYSQALAADRLLGYIQGQGRTLSTRRPLECAADSDRDVRKSVQVWTLTHLFSSDPFSVDG